MKRRTLLAFALFFGLLPHGSANSGLPRGGGGDALTLKTLEDSVVGQSFTIGGYGIYTGVAPTRATGRWTGCGGGTATITALTIDVYGSGTYLVQAKPPTATGNGCTLTITTDLGSTATSPPAAATLAKTGPEVVSNIHNAPGWLPSTRYAPARGPKTRVLNGPGWAPGTASYNPGKPLNAYELTSGSGCTSASSGGPFGTGSSISDGTCTWKYLSGVDYISITGYLFDGPPWVSGKTYTSGQVVTTNIGGLRAYQLGSNITLGYGPNQNSFCTSTVAPSGIPSTGGGAWWRSSLTTADGCVWLLRADIQYSSQVSYIPVQTYSQPLSPPNANVHMTRDAKALLWNDREYVAGTNFENSPMSAQDHTLGGRTYEAGGNGCPGGPTLPCHSIGLAAAPGESFRDRLTTSTPLTGYDPTKGVALRNALTGSPDGYIMDPVAFYVQDYYFDLDGLQLQSANAGAMFGSTQNGTFSNNIFDGGWLNGSWQADVYVCCGANVFVNNLIISHGPLALVTKYGPTYMIYNTIVNAGSVPKATAIAFAWGWFGPGPTVSNNAIYGFPHGGSFSTAMLGYRGPPDRYLFHPSSSHNVLTTAAPDTGLGPWLSGGTDLQTIIAMQASTYGVSGANMFVAPGTDWRPGPALIGAGASYGRFNGPNSPRDGPINLDSPDILGNRRPNGSGSWTVGAVQHP